MPSDSQTNLVYLCQTYFLLVKMVYLLFLVLDGFSAFHKLFTSIWSRGQFSAFRKGKLSAIACSHAKHLLVVIAK